YPIATPETLAEADGILFGMPTRFGTAPAQVKSLFDATGGLWQTGALIGKPAGMFFSCGGQGGGNETTALTTIPFLAHHGMFFVPLGSRAKQFGTLDEAVGGGMWGAGTYAGDGSRKPTERELGMAKVQGVSFAEVTKKLAAVP
ncbi:Nad quinone oxidoreductase, partial [Globisporangium polare]